MGNRKKYAKFQENLFSSNDIKSFFCPPLFRKRPIRDFMLVLETCKMEDAAIKTESAMTQTESNVGFC